MNENEALSPKLEKTIEAFQQPLLAFIKGRVGLLEDAQDILQEVWLQFSKRDSQDQIQSESGWLYRVSRNKIIDHYRKINPDWLEDLLEDEWEWEEEEQEEEFDPDSFWEDLYEALDALPENQREVFVLNEMEGLTLQEIADSTGEKLKTIISRKGYALRKLRDALEGAYG